MNPYVDGFKSCGQRLEETENTNPIMHMVSKMADPIKPNQGTHNHPTSTEVAGILIGEDDSYGGKIERDIMVEIREGGLQRIPYWHSAYMALQYLLFFLFRKLG